MDLFNLTVNIPYMNDKYDDLVDKMLRNCHYTHDFYGNSHQPMRTIIFHKINENTVNIIKNWFLETYKDHTYNSFCTFFLMSV